MNPLSSFANASGAGYNLEEMYGLGPEQLMYPGLSATGVPATNTPPVVPPVATPPAGGQPPPGSNGGGNGGAGGSNHDNAGNSGGNNGSAGDYSGHPGYGPDGRSLTAGGGAARDNAAAALGGGMGLIDSFGTPSGYISIPDWADHLWSAAGKLAPFPYGTAIGALKTGAHGYQTANTDALRRNMGYDSLDLGQIIGGVLNFNRYGDLSNPLAVNREQANAAHPNLTAGIAGSEQGGYYDPGFVARLFGAQGATEYTPEESRLRNSAAMIPGVKVNKNGTVTVDAGQFNLGNNGQGKGLGSDANQIHNNTVAGNKPSAGAEYDVASGTWSAPSNNNNNGGNKGGSSNEAKGNAGGSGDNKGAGAGGQSGGADPGGASGGADPRGDHYAHGGFIEGQPDNHVDNRQIHADEGEFMMNRGTAQAAPDLMTALNANPGMAQALNARLRGLPPTMQPPPMTMGEGMDHGRHWQGRDGSQWGGFMGSFFHGRPQGSRGNGRWNPMQAPTAAPAAANDQPQLSLEALGSGSEYPGLAMAGGW